MFYLGTHQPHWLWNPAADFPLFVSHRRLRDYVKLKRSTYRWALDSGGFTELSTYGEWRTSPGEYVRAVARYDREIGKLDWAAPQDWMCEPWIVAKTGGSVEGHQRATVTSYLQLAELWPQFSDARCPFVPVLQGWTVSDYLHCASLYRDQGMDLSDHPVVGLGSVCRRQGTAEISHLIELFTPHLALHAFGVKTRGLARIGHRLASADSMAWSYDARRNAPLPGHSHQNCANCLGWASHWRDGLLAQVYQAPAQDCLELDWSAA